MNIITICKVKGITINFNFQKKTVNFEDLKSRVRENTESSTESSYVYSNRKICGTSTYDVLSNSRKIYTVSYTYQA